MPDGSRPPRRITPGSLSLEDAARLLGLTWPMLHRAAKAGEVDGAVCINGVWTFKRQALLGWWRNLLATGREEAKAKRAASAHAAMVPVEDIIASAKPWPRKMRGIYFLLRKGRVIYVGQARDVGRRVGVHAVTKDFDAWAWVPVPFGSLDEMERAYIDALAPELNRDVVTVRNRLRLAAERAATEGGACA